jgi:hypothetical protein
MLRPVRLTNLRCGCRRHNLEPVGYSFALDWTQRIKQRIQYLKQFRSAAYEVIREYGR